MLWWRGREGKGREGEGDGGGRGGDLLRRDKGENTNIQRSALRKTGQHEFISIFLPSHIPSKYKNHEAPLHFQLVPNALDVNLTLRLPSPPTKHQPPGPPTRQPAPSSKKSPVPPANGNRAQNSGWHTVRDTLALPLTSSHQRAQEPCSSLVFGGLYHRGSQEGGRVARWCRLAASRRGSPESSHQLVLCTKPPGDCWPLLCCMRGTLHKKRAFIPGPPSICWEPGPCLPSLSPLWERRAGELTGMGMANGHCWELERAWVGRVEWPRPSWYGYGVLYRTYEVSVPI